LIQTAPVQNFARKKIVSFLGTKLKTRVEIRGLDIDFPKMLVLQGVYIEDRAKDTLIAGNELKVDIDMFKLLSKEIQINEINLNGITAKIKRQLPDTTFNFQFIADAFSSPVDTTVKKDTTAMKMAINKIIIDKSRFVYVDIVTGNDVDIYLNHFDTRINKFDPANLRYDVPSIVLNGVRGRVNQKQPMAVTAVVDHPNPADKNEAPKYLNFTNKEMLVSDFDISYSNAVSAMSTHLSFKNLNIHPENFDLKNSVVAIKDVQLNNLDGFYKIGKANTPPVVKLTNEKNKDIATAAQPLPWRFTIGAVRFDNNNFVFDDNTKPKAARGMDFAHMALKDLTLHADNFLFHNDTIALNIVEGRMKEKSGFKLDKFQTDVVYTDKGASLQNILIQTPGSEIKRSAIVRYPSLAAIQKQMGLLEVDLNIDSSYLQVKDILTFVPTLSSQPAFQNPSSRIYINARIKGSLDRLNIETFQFRGLHNTSIDIAGLISNSMDTKNAVADLNIRKFTTSSADLVSLMPAGTLPKGLSLPAVMNLDGRLRGGMRHLEINNLHFRDTRNTNIDLSGIINNATDPKNIYADININRFNTNRTEIFALAPAGSIPKNINVPQTISLHGKVKGGMKSIATDLTLNTSLGSARVNGKISNAADKNNARYNATISATALNVGAIMQQPQNVGAVTASFSVDGRGYNPDNAKATIKGNIISAEVKKYTYRNLAFNASLANQKFTANAGIQDPNIHVALQAEGNMGGKLPGFVINANIDSIKTLPLHLTPNAIIYRGKITANVPELNLDALNGQIFVVNSLLVMNGQRIALDSLSVIASNVNNQQTIALKTDFASAQIQGQYKLLQLGDILMETIQPYYAIIPVGTPVKNVDPYNFSINVNVIDHPTLHAFVPNLKRFDGITLTSNFSSSDGWNANMAAPNIVYGTNTINGVAINALGKDSSLNIVTNVNQFTSGSSIALYGTRLTTALANNRINFGLSIKDKAAKNKYRLGGVFAQEPGNIYAVSLKPDSLMLNYDTWSISPDNLIRFGSTIVNARNFDLSQNNQHLIINSLTTAADSPLRIAFNNFRLATLSAFVQSDSLLADGMLNGNVQVKDILKQPNFTTDLTLNNLAIKKDTIGDVNIKVNNNTQNVFATNVTITGKGNNVSLTGNYYLKPANNSNFDFNLNIKQLPFKTIEAASMGAINQSTGNLTGSVAISGTTKNPKIDGGITFNQTGFNAVMLGSYFKIDGETIKVNNQGIAFNSFTIKDSADNALVIDGLAGTTNFVNYKFNLTVKARDFRAINTTKKQNSLYYGKLYFSTNLNIKGTESAPIVDGMFRVNPETDLSIVIPQSEPGVVARKGVIEFVDMDAPENDTLFKQVLVKYDSSFNKSAVTGMDVSVNLVIAKEANFNIIVDEANGDFLNVRGDAALTTGIDPSGKITMTGTYTIDHGSYDLSFNFLHRRFEIQKGSKITWTGEPTTADASVTAVYVANTSALDLVADQVSQAMTGYYQQKLPFQVKLMINGQLMQPTFSFDITLPTENNVRVSNEILTTVNTRLDQIRAEPSELNKQVFALLLLNRFVGQDPFQSSSGGGGFNAGAFARQSVSKILTEQLNRLAGDLIKGVDINFDVNSAADYTTGQRRDRTDFNVALSKRLLNDRLKVTVGSNYELEGPQQSNQTASNVIGNVSLDYNLSKDGRYMLRGYRKNDYEAVVEGYVIETGIKFIITVDYNKFNEIFHKRKPKNQLKKEAKTSAGQATTTNSPADGNQTVSFTDKISADDRKAIPPAVKDSTDGN
ncbi:MAG: translocation/assembly module TamB, partial [Bacteroidota bacterium]|nr:translocation/assembly module TamB [Bacteroidota bacterium]